MKKLIIIVNSIYCMIHGFRINDISVFLMGIILFLVIINEKITKMIDDRRKQEEYKRDWLNKHVTKVK
jgi:hypothetical protein